MKNLNKKRVNTVFGAYVGALIVGAITINALSGDILMNMPFNASKSDMEKFNCKVESLMESRLSNVEIEHVDITGLKEITRKRRDQSLERINGPQQATPTFASYKYQPMPATPVEFLGELTNEKRAEIRTKITGVSRQYIGRPYVYAAKGPNAFDCSGYTSFIMRQFGVMISPGSRYQATQGRHVDLEKAKVGDLLFFSAYGRGGVITHVGLILDNSAEGITVIHANGPRHGIMVENVSRSSYWKNKILFARDVISADSRPARP